MMTMAPTTAIPETPMPSLSYVVLHERETLRALHGVAIALHSGLPADARYHLRQAAEELRIRLDLAALQCWYAPGTHALAALSSALWYVADAVRVGDRGEARRLLIAALVACGVIAVEDRDGGRGLSV
jgi:hypothetical protein